MMSEKRNIHDAAEKYADSMGLKGFDKIRTMSDFEAGVQWLANQGETEEFEITQDEDEGCPSFYLNWLGHDGLCPLDPNKYKDGDVVELQLRKKL